MHEGSGEEALSRSEQFAGYFYNAPPLGMAYCLAKPRLALMQCQPVDLPRLSASAHISAANTLTLLIRVSATVTVYREHRRTLFLQPGIISLFITCLGIIRNNSLVDECARTVVWTPATERLTLYCTWRPSALTTGPHGPVLENIYKKIHFSYMRSLCYIMHNMHT